MVSKKQLLEQVDEALRTEEQLMAIYAGHCLLFLDLLKTNRNVHQEFRGAFLKLRDDSRRHRDELNELGRELRLRTDRDAY